MTGSVVPDPSTTVAYGDPVLPVLITLASLPGIALAFRRRQPVVAFAVTAAAMITVTVLGWQEGTLPWSLLVAAYALGAWATARRGGGALAAMYAAIVLLVLIDAPQMRDGSPAETLIFLVPWVIGLAVGRRRLVDERAVAETLTAERAHAAAAERALTGQRLAVARDLHDLVTHGVSALTVQAASMPHRLDPGPARDVLERIESTGRDALADLRRMHKLLGDGQPAQLAPAPGPGDLEALVALHRAAHGPVTLKVDVAVELEPESIRLAAYRLVQEALTNVARHAPGAATTVSVRSTPTSVVVQVEDEGSKEGPSSMPSGEDLVRAGVVSLLDADETIEVVGQAGNGLEAVRLIERTRPMVALVDIRMPQLNGIDVICRIRSGPVGDTCRLVVLTTFGLDDYVFGAIRAGADALLLKDAPPEDLLRSVRAVAAGDAVMSPSVTRILIDDYVRRPTTRRAASVPHLTNRESDILAGICEGLSNRQIAERLYIGPATVKTYVSRLLDKFGVGTRVGLVIAAHEAGLPPTLPDEPA